MSLEDIRRMQGEASAALREFATGLMGHARNAARVSAESVEYRLAQWRGRTEELRQTDMALGAAYEEAHRLPREAAAQAYEAHAREAGQMRSEYMRTKRPADLTRWVRGAKLPSDAVDARAFADHIFTKYV